MKKNFALLSLVLCSLFISPLICSFASSRKSVGNGEVDETLHFQRAHAVGLSMSYYVMNTSDITGTTSISDPNPKIASYLLSSNFTFTNVTFSFSHEPVDGTDYRLYVTLGLIADSGFEYDYPPTQSDYLNLSQTRTEVSLTSWTYPLYTMCRLLVSAEVKNSSGMHREILWGNPTHDSYITYTGKAEYLAESKPVHNLDTGLDYTTITESIDDNQTLAGDTIFVESGTYFEPLTVNKQVSLVGENVDDTIIYGINGLAYAPAVVVITVGGVTIKGFTIRENNVNNVGTSLDSVENCSIIGNKLSNLDTGVLLNYSSNNRIVGNNFTYMWFAGIGFYYGMYNDVVGNVINHTGFYVMQLSHSSNNTIRGNYLSGTDYGIGFYDDSDNNSVFNNNFVGSYGYPVFLQQVQGNAFNAEYPTGGNYFEGYNGADSNQDGIGDSPEPLYYIGQNVSQDNLPLMGLFSSFNTSQGYTVEVVSNSTIEDFAYFDSNSTIRMHVSNMTANQTMGFCRIAVPHALMNETYHITIDGAEPSFANYTIYDNGTHRWIYFTYQLSTHEITIVPEFPTFLPILIFMTLTLLATTIDRVRRRK